MKAVTIPTPGELAWVDVADPTPGPGEVLLEVVAAGVNRADLLQRAGFYPPPPGAPPYPGMEVSGRVAALGSGVAGWSVGDEACALLAGGGYAELVAAPVAHCLPVPAGVSLVDAAGLPEAAATVWSNVVDLAHLRAGETLLVHGGGSGIGTFAIQLGAALGARVVTTARADRHQALRELGAAETIDYTTGDFTGVGADVILDIMGAAYLERNVTALNPGGRLVVIGLQGGTKGELNLGAMLAKRATLFATTLRARSAAEKAAIIAGVREQVWPLVAAGRVRPVIDARVPMAQAADAHRRLDAAHLGKILLTR